MASNETNSSIVCGESAFTPFNFAFFAKHFAEPLFEPVKIPLALVPNNRAEHRVQYATAALLHLEAFAVALPSSPPELELARHFLDKTLKESRRLMNGIRPPVLDESGLIPAIEQIIMKAAVSSQRSSSTTSRPAYSASR